MQAIIPPTFCVDSYLQCSGLLDLNYAPHYRECVAHGSCTTQIEFIDIDGLWFVRYDLRVDKPFFYGDSTPWLKRQAHPSLIDAYEFATNTIKSSLSPFIAQYSVVVNRFTEKLDQRFDELKQGSLFRAMTPSAPSAELAGALSYTYDIPLSHNPFKADAEIYLYESWNLGWTGMARGGIHAYDYYRIEPLGPVSVEWIHNDNGLISLPVGKLVTYMFRDGSTDTGEVVEHDDCVCIRASNSHHIYYLCHSTSTDEPKHVDIIAVRIHPDPALLQLFG